MAAVASVDPDHEQWESSGQITGLDFGGQILQRFYTIQKVPTGSCTPHLLFYKPVVSSSAFGSLRPVLSLGRSIIKWKYIIFLFNNPELKSRVAAMWPEKVQLKHMKECLLKSLHDCELQRVKIWKEGMTIYLYAVKLRDEQFVMQDVWARLQQLVNEKGDIF
ncbi:hypothetical protein O6H91_11G018500 [Diphasiastrum complanatum]|uniref:Uncharacterized protein n=1 Tax=Diphasiastrum complanatum TaxID=34168 RepID=A0ACC2C6V1_DIPCM|nr:hypothetical protein O6H91_Y431700 [Diphasiastrum complanatum]KAJ7537720.1 hypothetical protein O6H91_11G018500 [Diphasiastrum complanatum]